MPSKKQYDLVQNDDYDTRIPLHSDEAFQHGISFQAKYIGTLEVPRPLSRVEIVAAMRRIRYDFKAKNVKKKKVTVEISVDSVRVTLRKKKKKKHPWLDDRPLELLSHPIYRIFYVSHDSSDLKIFSYIARDGATDIYKCSVFKTNKKSQAMRIVRTVGQAFEVCHKLAAANEATPEPPSEADDTAEDLHDHGDSPPDSPTIHPDKDIREDMFTLSDELVTSTQPVPTERPKKLELLPPPPANIRRSISKCEPSVDTMGTPTTPSQQNTVGTISGSATLTPGGSVAAQHELQLLRERLEQQSQQTCHAVAQLLLLRDQLAAETSARVEAQSRAQQLLIHNRELLDHITALVAHLQDPERVAPGLQGLHQGIPNVTAVPQDNSTIDNSKPSTEKHFSFGPVTNSSVRKSCNNNISTSPNQNTVPANVFNFPQENIYRFPSYGCTSTPEQTFPYIYSNHNRHNVDNNYNNLLQPQYGGNNLQQTSAQCDQPSPSISEVGSDETAFIRPLSQVGTLTTMDSDGRVRVIVPVNEETHKKGRNTLGNLPSMVTLRITDEGGHVVIKPGSVEDGVDNMTKSASEKTHRSDMNLNGDWPKHTNK